MQSAFYSCRILMKLDISRQIFEQSSNIKFHENPFSWSRVVPNRRKDMTRPHSHFSRCCKRALNKKKNTVYDENYVHRLYKY